MNITQIEARIAQLRTDVAQAREDWSAAVIAHIEATEDPKCKIGAKEAAVLFNLTEGRVRNVMSEMRASGFEQCETALNKTGYTYDQFKAKLGTRKIRNFASEPKRLAAVTLKENGFTIAQIAEAMNLSTATIANMIK